MEDISGIDENDNSKKGPFELFFKTGEPRGTGGLGGEEQKHDAWRRYPVNGKLWDEGLFGICKKKGTWKVKKNSPN